MFTRFVYHGLTCTVKIGPVCSIDSLLCVFSSCLKKSASAILCHRAVVFSCDALH